MARLGYEEIPEDMALDEESARHELELGLMIAKMKTPEETPPESTGS